MAKLKIVGIYGFDGEYDLDISKFTGDELHTIKQIAGVRGGELSEALQAGDYDLVIAFAVIVLRRAGKTVDPKEISAAEVGAITVDLQTGQEVEARPPGSAPPSGSESLSGDSNVPSAATHPSGLSSSNGGDPLPSLPAPTGELGSETSVPSDRVTSAT
jgi:hypothetical protein